MPGGQSPERDNVSSLLLGIPLGVLAIRIFLWLISLLAAYGLHQLVVSASTSPASSGTSAPVSAKKYEPTQVVQGSGILCLPTDLDEP